MSLTRRGFLKTTIVAAGTLTAFGALPAGAVSTLAGLGRAFPQGVASGDPKPGSVILWTRVVGDQPAADIPLRLQVSDDARDFRPGRLRVDTVVTALAENDGCVRIKVTGLPAGTSLYYRFIALGLRSLSPVGRTRTAPADGANVPVRFALANCQDYIGRFFNGYLPLLQPENDDIDFLLHIGDFIYETTGDPTFQSPGGRRDIVFEDQAGAIALGDAANPYYAARSLSNYRQLHRTYRSDRVLRRVLAKFPLIAIWDDHEFSDDRWQTNATYFDGRKSEADLERLHNAERAWLEYMPIDDAGDDVAAAPADIIDKDEETKLWDRTRVYRGLRFGANLDLCLLDYRSFRPDHLIPEEAFPAAIIATEAEVEAKYADPAQFAADRASLAPYIDWATLPPALQVVLTQVVAGLYQAEGDGDPPGRAAAALVGKTLDINYLNALLQAVGLTPLPVTDATPRGLSYFAMGKTELFGSFGARYALNSKLFDLFTLFRSLDEQNVYGDAQQAFLEAKLSASTAAWSFVASSVSQTTMRLDFSQDFTTNPAFGGLNAVAQAVLLGLQQQLPQLPFGQHILLNADHWDGFPARREALLDLYRNKGNVIMLAGDIHASWVTDHSAAGKPLFEFTGMALSSSSFADEILDQIAALAAGLVTPEQLALIAGDLVTALNEFLFEKQPESGFVPLVQDLRYINVGDNGIVIFDVNSGAVDATYWLLPAAEVKRSYYLARRAGLAKFTTRRFRVAGGELTEL